MAMLDDVKAALRITHNEDDAYLSDLIIRATREYVSFILGVPPDDMSTVNVPQDAVGGIILMIQADYDGDPVKRPEYRKAAEALWMPYRENIGV